MSGARTPMHEREKNAADVQESKPTQETEGPWLPCPHEDEGGSQGPCPSSPKGTLLPDGERRNQSEAPPVGPPSAIARPLGDGRRFRYPRSARLRRGPEIRTLVREGLRRRCGPLEVYRAVSRTHQARAGIVVPRYGHTIVERNRLKRRLRECVRTTWLPGARDQTPPPEILIRARPGAYELGFDALRNALGRCTVAE